MAAVTALTAGRMSPRASTAAQRALASLSRSSFTRIGTAAFASDPIPLGPYGRMANVFVLVLEQFRQRRRGRFRLGADVPQGLGGDHAKVGVLVLEQLGQRRRGRLRFGTDSPQGSGGAAADQVRLCFGAIPSASQRRPSPWDRTHPKITAAHRHTWESWSWSSFVSAGIAAGPIALRASTAAPRTPSFLSRSNGVSAAMAGFASARICIRAHAAAQRMSVSLSWSDCVRTATAAGPIFPRLSTASRRSLRVTALVPEQFGQDWDGGRPHLRQGGDNRQLSAQPGMFVLDRFGESRKGGRTHLLQGADGEAPGVPVVVLEPFGEGRDRGLPRPGPSLPGPRRRPTEPLLSLSRSNSVRAGTAVFAAGANSARAAAAAQRTLASSSRSAAVRAGMTAFASAVTTGTPLVHVPPMPNLTRPSTAARRTSSSLSRSDFVRTGSAAGPIVARTQAASK